MEDFVELCFKDGSPLVSLQKPVAAAPLKADLATPARPQLLPESQALPPVPEVTDEADRPTTAAPAVEGGARVSRPPELVTEPVAPLPPPPPSRVSDLDGPPAPPSSHPHSSDIADEETVMSVDALSRTSALPPVEEATNTSEIDFQIPQNIGPVSAGQTILPMDDDEYRSFASPPPERPAPTIAPPVTATETPTKEPVAPPAEKATPVNRGSQKTIRPTPPPAPSSNAPLGLAVMGLTAGAVVLVGLLVIWFWHNQQQGEGNIVVPATPPVAPPVVPVETQPATPQEAPTTPPVAPETAPTPVPGTPETAPTATVAPPVAPADPAKSGVIRFNGLPSGATITADGKPYTVGASIAYGTHEVKVEAAGYQPVKLLVTVNGPEASVSPKFVAVGRTVTVQLSCQGAKPCTALIDGQASVGLPSDQPLTEGLHSFRVGSCSVYRKVEAGTNPQTIELPCSP